MKYKEMREEWRLLNTKSAEIKSRKYELRRLMAQVSEDKRVCAPRTNMLERGKVIVDLYKQGKTLNEIGIKFGISRERVRQIIKGMGLAPKDGGYSVRVKACEKECRAEGCKKLATGSYGYCPTHYVRVRTSGTTTIEYKNKFQIHEDTCVVEGCDKPFKANGLCNKHCTNFYLSKRAGNVSDLKDYLNVQKAKEIMNKSYAKFTETRAFMESNKELFEGEVNYDGR